MSSEVVRNRPGIRMSIGEAVAILALLVTVFSSFNGWFILPEKVSSLQKESEKQDARILKAEQFSAAAAETFARIDERTKRIEESIKNLDK